MYLSEGGKVPNNVRHWENNYGIGGLVGLFN